MIAGEMRIRDVQKLAEAAPQNAKDMSLLTVRREAIGLYDGEVRRCRSNPATTV